MQPKQLHEYVGVIHIHSNYSDGSKSIPEIVKAACSVGLDFLLISDHMTLQALHDGYEGWYEGVLVLVGYEIHDPNNRNHYLAFNLEKMVEPGLAAEEYVKKVKEAGGIGFVSHPSERRNALPEYPSYPWTAWDVDGFDGIEIWNYMSEWMEGLTRGNKLWHYLFHRDRLLGPAGETLRWWDELNHRKKVVGIGGVDAHGIPHRWGPFTLVVFPYRPLFQSVRTHVLINRPLHGNIQQDKPAFYQALASGNCFISHYRKGNARGFRFWAEAMDRITNMGETIPIAGKVKLNVWLPLEGEIRFIADGKMVARSRGKEAHFVTERSGAYRVEVYRKGGAWIFSNHIRLVKA